MKQYQMVPKNKLKTYAGPNKSVINTSVDVFNNLLAKNLSRRGVQKRKRKNLVKELPQRVVHTLLVDDSFHISTEDTFDKLLKNRTGGTTSKNASKSSSRSPVWTRSRSRSFSQTGRVSLTSQTSAIHDTKRSSLSYSKKSKQTSDKALGSKVFQKNGNRTTSQVGSTFQASDISDIQANKSSSNMVLKRFQQTTIDPVYESIEVEAVPTRASVHSSSYLKIPETRLSKANNVSADCTFPNSSLINFKDYPVANSTPFVLDRRKNAIENNAPDSTDVSDNEELLQRIEHFKGFDVSKSTTSAIQQKPLLVVSLDEFNHFQSKNNIIGNSENSSEMGCFSTISHNEPNDFVTKRRRIASSTSAIEDGLLSKECHVVIEKCDQSLRNEQCNTIPESGNGSSSGSICSNMQFEDFFAKNHQLVLEQFGKDTRELVVNVTNYDLNDSIPITNNTVSEITIDFHSEDNTLESRKSVTKDNSTNVDSNKELRVNLVKQDYCNKELVVNVTLNEFQVNTSTDQCTQTEFEYGVKELFVDLTLYKQEVIDIEDEVTCKNSTQEIPEFQVNRGTSMEIIDLTNSLRSVSKTNLRNSNRLTDSTIISDVNTQSNNLTNNLMKSPRELNNILRNCHSPDMFNDSIHLNDNLSVRHDKDLEMLGITLKDCNTVDESVNLIESSLVDIPSSQQNVFKVPEPVKRKAIVLRSGKHWRRSLSVFKNTSLISEDALQDDCLSGVSFDTVSTNDIAPKTNRVSVRIVPLKTSVISRKTSVLKDYASTSGYVPTEAEQQRDSQLREENLENSLRSLSLREATLLQQHHPVTAREIVLSRCQQTEPWKFSDCYPDSVLQHCQKIGEGVYGEVYLLRNPKGGTSVIKIIPIEGSLIVNGERQKKYEEILSEIVISMELSNLRKNTVNSTSGFTELQEVKCIQGCYPERLLDLWHLYDETKGSENECPDSFTEDQLYIILQLADGGKDLESFVAFALAVAEEELHFEHRDLHWGNVLLKSVEKNTKVRFTLNGNVYIVPTKGIQATIIDFTLSRVEYDGVVIFNDLSLDPDLFTAEGDYQFDIYRLMQKENGNNWQNFVPYTNVLWLHYILDKSITLLRYKNPGKKLHKEYLNKLKELEEEVLNYRSVKDFVLECLT
nr:unnamed protein product [Callosobruchus analis]